MIPAPIKTPKTRRQAFSLVEVTLALGLVAFALIPLMGLLTMGLKTNRENMNRSLKAQMVSWVQGDVRWRDGSYSVNFDEFAVVTGNSQADYQASIKPQTISLPGGSQTVAAWDVVIHHQSGGNRKIEEKIVWGSL